jgi:tRNA threonylcarbamoyladenosine biosynthesis protein TsaE
VQPVSGLTHVDAYRITSVHEWDDLDLDVESAAMVIEWGERVVTALPADHLEIRIVGDDHARTLTIAAHGPRSTRLLAALEGFR